MTTYPWKVEVRNAALERVGELDDYQQLEMVLKFNDISTWQLTVNRSNRLAADLVADGAGIVVSRDGTTILSGPAIDAEHHKDNSANILTLSGVDDSVWLKRRLAHPQPTSTAPPYSTTAEDVRTGVASTIMRQYVGANAVPGVTDPARAVAGLSRLADIAYGTSVTGRGRWQLLLTLLQELAVSGAVGGLPVGFRVVQVGSGIQYQQYIPVDRTATAVFSEGFGNVTEFTYKRSTPAANYFYVGGSGEGTARTIFEQPDSDSIATWGRIEGELVDAQSAATTAELGQAATKAAADQGLKTSLSVTPIDTDTLSYGIHYGLGDRVTAVLDVIGPDGDGLAGDSVQDIIRECTITLTPDASTVTSSVGSQDASLSFLRVIKVVKDLGRRMNNRERR